MVPQQEHVHHWVSMKLLHEMQTHPRGFLSALRSRDLMVSSARVRFLKRNASPGFALFPSFRSKVKGLFFELPDSKRSGGFECRPEVGLDSVLVGGGRSAAQTSQHRKVDGFSSVHIGQIQGVSYELLSAVRSTISSCFDGWASFGSVGRASEIAGVISEAVGGGDDFVRGPAGFS